MKLTNKLEEELKTLYLLYFESLFGANVERYVSFFVDDFKQFGTTLEEAWFSKSESGAYLGTHVGPVAGKIELRNRDIKMEAVDRLILIIEQADCFVNIDGIWAFYDRIRISSLMQNTVSGWKFVQQHMSFPDSRTEEGQTVALEKIKAENIKLKAAVKRRTTELEKKNLELKQAILNLKSTQAQLIQQEKLASLGQLTAGIAHEIKNPLNFVNNFSEVSLEMLSEINEERAKSQEIRDESLVDEILADVVSNIQKVREHGKRADEIVKSMLQHSRGGSGKKSPMDVNALVREFANLAFHGMRASKKPIDVALQLDLGKDVGEIPMILEDLSRVIINICSNAFDAMREKLSKPPADEKNGDCPEQAESYQPMLKVSTAKHEGKVIIAFRDNGVGIPDEIRDKIMQPFFTTKKGTEGTGLGLSITHDILKAHGGDLKIESEPGIGTVVQIFFNPPK
ncbi:nuclear transport factor 2 family protein [Algoriphagus aestuariicola]|uniref:histidine kinase n=1 Tax=Algoriphagus aestuariicola TaxID=1852016 RepID=A0ABS3BNZ6_9BACT|nr:ATP-binding protein [Algoriphagus aestuariicola]MBN7800626.1 nuclear transport factor 2 family protein [Algoriphagus aestuariicola]